MTLAEIFQGRKTSGKPGEDNGASAKAGVPPKMEDSMTTHAGLPVAGYQPQTDDKVQTVNRAKELEERVLRHLDGLAADAAVDQRMVAIARTGIQEAFMWANRAVFQPGRVKLPEDQP
jgi:hypothetical protein